MAFTQHGTLNTHGAPVLRKEIAANSIDITVEDSVKADTDGFVALGTAAALVFGHVVGIASAKDVGMQTDGSTGAAMGSFQNTYTTASDNETVAKVRAECDVSKMTLYSAEHDDTIGSTTGSNLLGYFLDLEDEDTLDESSCLTTTLQYFNWGLDPNNSARSIVNIYQSVVFGV